HRRYGMNIYSMNALQKLIDTEAYEKFVSVDRVLRFVLRSAVSTVELDKGLLRGEVENRSDYLADFSTTLRELQGKLDMRGDVSQPIFAYAQPKNLHILVCYEADVPPGEEYPGFYAPYAARVRRVDASFGRFIEYLKARGLYNDSVVILTSDHGDALGEGGGRWGHSNWVFPEIIRVPLIIHLPSRLAKAFTCDPSKIAFTTDITPSLYYLLGHKPTLRDENFGRSLFTSTAEEEQAAHTQQSYLVASSYGAVYGIIRNNGQFLYIANG